MSLAVSCGTTGGNFEFLRLILVTSILLQSDAFNEG